MSPIASALLVATTLFAGGAGSYEKLTEPEDASAFYREHGAKHVGDLVHLHVPASVIHGKALKPVRLKSGKTYHLFKNRSVPLLAQTRDVYFRYALQRTAPGDTLCVKGRVIRQPLGGKGRHCVFVHTIKKAPGGGRRDSGGKSG